MAELAVVFRGNNQEKSKLKDLTRIELELEGSFKSFRPTVSAKIGSVHLEAGTAAENNNVNKGRHDRYGK